MSIVVTAKVGEGLVLGADSAVSLVVKTPDGQIGVTNTFNHGNKLAQIKDYPVGTLTWGAGTIVDRTIGSLINEFENDLEPMRDSLGHIRDFTVKDIACPLAEFFYDRYKMAQQKYGLDKSHGPEVGLHIGGFSKGSFFPDEFVLLFPRQPTPSPLRPVSDTGEQVFGVNWWGQSLPIIRFIKGFDSNIIGSIVKAGVISDEKKFRDMLSQAEFPCEYGAMPIQDAIDFVKCLISLTIEWFRFRPGPPVCGGEIDIAVVTPDGFQWIRRKEWRA